jgi:hypothetical protein
MEHIYRKSQIAECSGRLSTLVETLWQQPVRVFALQLIHASISRVAAQRAVSALQHRDGYKHAFYKICTIDNIYAFYEM